jgi:hypothetical protein
LTSDKTNKKHWLGNAIKFTLPLVLSFIFLYIAFYDENISKILVILSNASIFWIVILIVVMLFSHYLRALRWKVILHSVKPDASIINIFGAVMVGYGVSCVVPRLGEVSRAVVLGKWEKLSRSSMFGTVILERIIDIIFLGLTVIVSVIIWSEDLYIKFPWLKSTLYLSIILMAGIILFMYFLVRFREKFYGLIIKIIGKFSEKIANKAAYIFDMVTKGFASLKGTKNYIYTFILSALIMIIYALSAYIGFYTLGMENVKPVTYGMAWVLMSISAFGVVIPTPGGIGSYEAISKAALVLLFGFGESISLAYAILTHVISYFLFIFTSLLFFFALNKHHDNLIKVVETKLEEL